jgi:hypothetical protein
MFLHYPASQVSQFLLAPVQSTHIERLSPIEARRDARRLLDGLISHVVIGMPMVHLPSLLNAKERRDINAYLG